MVICIWLSISSDYSISGAGAGDTTTNLKLQHWLNWGLWGKPDQKTWSSECFGNNFAPDDLFEEKPLYISRLGTSNTSNGAKDSRVVAGSFFHLTNSAKIENIFSQSDVEKMVWAFVTLKLTLTVVIIFLMLPHKFSIAPNYCGEITETEAMKERSYFSYNIFY